jgi:invasion protein IalB
MRALHDSMRAVAGRAVRACLPLAALAAAAAMAAPAAAAQTANRVDAKKDWSVFTADVGGKVCWVVTQPTRSTARRDSKPVSVQRGDIYLMVSVRPNKGVKNEVSMIAGYPFQGGGSVKASIGSDEFEMFTEGESAWLASSEADDRMVRAMKAGATAVLTGISSRGTTTTDTFSLSGFTAALDVAQDLCK